jgi:hypothetical protein
MTIYYDDKRDYSEIVEGWVRDFIDTMDHEDDSVLKSFLMVLDIMKKLMKKMRIEIPNPLLYSFTKIL